MTTSFFSDWVEWDKRVREEVSSKVIPFKRPKKPATDQEYFDYAIATGGCPLCGKALEVQHECRCCKTVEVKCSCGFNMERRIE